MPIVNNYGVWTDEYKALGLEHTLELTFPDAVSLREGVHSQWAC